MCLSALKSAGYTGVICIEYEGEGDAEFGIKRTRALLDKYG
jgi:hydroxypyruvate isomerase